VAAVKTFHAIAGTQYRVTGPDNTAVVVQAGPAKAGVATIGIMVGGSDVHFLTQANCSDLVPVLQAFISSGQLI
jgi:hypothetical protein